MSFSSLRFLISLSIATFSGSGINSYGTAVSAKKAINEYGFVTKWAQSDPNAANKLDAWLSEPDEENLDVPSCTLMKNRKWLAGQGLPYENGTELCDYLKHRTSDAKDEPSARNKILDEKIINEIIERPIGDGTLVLANAISRNLNG